MQIRPSVQLQVSSQRTSHGPLTRCTCQEMTAMVVFPEDAEESWSFPTAAGDLLPLHRRDPPGILHVLGISAAQQLTGQLFSGSSQGNSS